MKEYRGILSRLDGKPITPRTKYTEMKGYWTHDPDTFIDNKPLRFFYYEDAPDDCSNRMGVSMEVNACEKIGNTYRFVDWNIVPFEFILLE